MSPLVVAIPVRDEAALIGDCLRALALQQGELQADIVLLVNNSRDGTAELARAMQPALPCCLHVIEHEFAAPCANAGHARRLAMDHAVRLAEPGGLILTTDADSCVAPDWLEANLAALVAGADVVCGRAVIDPVDALRIPDHLHADDAREVAYGTALDRLRALLDPDPADPWPRHTEESGASLAVRREALLKAGGVPAVPLGEDRALVAALHRVDACVRHAPDVYATVSGRTQGRAVDGMADTIRRRLVRQDETIDGSMEPVADRVRRIGARRLLRLAWRDGGSSPVALDRLADKMRVTRDDLDCWLGLPFFGAAWAEMEARSPVLTTRPVFRAELPAQMRMVSEVLARVTAASETALRVQSIARTAIPPDSAAKLGS